MKKLYVVDNHGEYSDHTYWLVIADADEWDDLLGILTRGGRGQSVEAVASEWSGITEAEAAHPLDTLRVQDDLFAMGDHRKGPPPSARGPGCYWLRTYGSGEDSWHFMYSIKEPRPSRRDAENLLTEMRRRAAAAKEHCFDTDELAMFEAAFAAGEFG